MVQSIGQASGVVAAGAAFVIPALYINQLQPVWWHIFLACAIGGFLGIVLIIPLRRYFVRDLHGELPFPEATAMNEILVSGESAGKGAGKVLLSSIGLGGAFDFLVETVHAWNPSARAPPRCSAASGEKLGRAALRAEDERHRRALRARLHHRPPLLRPSSPPARVLAYVRAGAAGLSTSARSSTPSPSTSSPHGQDLPHRAR